MEEGKIYRCELVAIGGDFEYEDENSLKMYWESQDLLERYKVGILVTPTSDGRVQELFTEKLLDVCEMELTGDGIQCSYKEPACAYAIFQKNYKTEENQLKDTKALSTKELDNMILHAYSDYEFTKKYIAEIIENAESRYLSSRSATSATIDDFKRLLKKYTKSKQ